MNQQEESEVEIKRITENVFQLNIRHFQNRYVNVYALLGDTVTLIDTGHANQSCLSMLKGALLELGYGLEQISHIIYTHPHLDHLGGGLAINETYEHINNIAYAGAVDIFRDYAEFSRQFVEHSQEFAEKMGHGAHPSLIKETKDFFRIYNDCTPYRGLIINTPVENGDILKIGDFELEVLFTPSHSPWDTSIYDAKRGLFYSGDFLLERGTSFLSFITEADLGCYLTSLKKVEGYGSNINTILPGHGRAIENPKMVINRCIRNFHIYEKRILKTVGEEKATVYETAHALIKGRMKDVVLWYRYIGMVHTYFIKLMKENKVKEVRENEKLYYCLTGQGREYYKELAFKKNISG